MIKNFYESIKYSTQESQVQEVYNEALKSVFNISIIERKHQCDGYLETKTSDNKEISILIEYKYDIHMKDRVQRSKVIAQCLGYLKQFEQSGEKLPKLVFIGDINECCVIHTNDLLRYLDLDSVDWYIAPSTMGDKNVDLVFNIAKDVSPWVYDVNEDFKFQEVAEKIIDLCSNTNRKLHITEKNIEKVYNLFCDRVIKDKKKVQANDLVSTFIGAMLDSEHYYQHPKKKNTLIANDKQVAINGDQFELFMQMHSTEYSPKEKRIMTAISDRLIEDTNRRNKGEFYTPTLFVNYAHSMIERELGQHWKENYVVWDCCCGTKNLTRDYRFKELYCSTLEQAELDISKNYNKEATPFQFDFLNDSIDDLKIKAPGLLEAFELNKPICFFINPPYANGSGKGNAKGTHCSDELARVMQLDGFKSGELIIQFLWRISYIKRNYNLTNCCIACFTNPTWLCGTLTEKFRSVWMSNFEYKSGVMFNAGEFANVSAQWGITFNIWKTGITNDRNNFTHTLIESFDNQSQIRELGTKTLYNRDNTDYTPISVFVKSSNNTYKQSVSSLKISDLSLSSDIQTVSNQKYLNAMITYNGDYVQNNLTCWIQSGYRKGNATFIDASNFEKACLIFSIRKLITTNWVLDKDSYLIKRDQNLPDEFKCDCIVYSIVSCYGTSLKQDDLICKNEFFCMSKQEMLDLAEKYKNDYTYEDALNSEERFAYTKLQEIKDNLSPEAKAVLDKATELVKKSFKYREMFNESHPEYQINNWDCGFYQIKALLKEFMPDDLKDFRNIYKQLADKMRPKVYELGFLKK